METLDTLADAYSTEVVYQSELAEQGKQNVANLNSSYDTMAQIAAHLFSMIEVFSKLDYQIDAAAEAYAETLQDPNEQGYAYNYGMGLEESK